MGKLADERGLVKTRNMERVLRHMGENPAKAEVQDMINEVDVEGAGVCKFPEFLDMMAGRISNLTAETEMREAFAVFDLDGNGFVSRSELKYAMQNLGEEVTSAECQYLLEEADIDGDGQINYEEFY